LFPVDVFGAVHGSAAEGGTVTVSDRAGSFYAAFACGWPLESRSTARFFNFGVAMRLLTALLQSAAVWPIAASLVALDFSPASAQADATFHAEYTVAIKDMASHLFHVTATFRNVRQPQLELSLPIWTPGWYTLEYYGKNVSHFVATDGVGAHLPAHLVRAQAWSIDARGKNAIVIEFDYRANVLALNQAKITSKYAFFTGTQLFLEPLGHRSASSSVRFVVPNGWRIVSALHETAYPNIYSARDYDELVDAPTWLGAFDLHSFTVDGKPHLLVLDSANRLPPIRSAVIPNDSLQWFTSPAPSLDVCRTTSTCSSGCLTPRNRRRTVRSSTQIRMSSAVEGPQHSV
jgi:hypothetical protein